MIVNTRFIIFCIFTGSILLIACRSEKDLQSPEKLGELLRSNVKSGESAAEEINNLHGREVSTKNNLVAEYGTEKKDILYVSEFESQETAEQTFHSMIQKIAHSQAGIFQHLMAMKKYNNKVYMTLGMGAVHYIYCSEKYIIWLQTHQRFGMELPGEVLNIYPL